MADFLIPDPDEPVGRVLGERTLQVKPIQYYHYTEDPSAFRQDIHSANGSVWHQAIDNELENIEDNEVWVNHYEEPAKHLHSTWVF